jgi:hypothetical protein
VQGFIVAEEHVLGTYHVHGLLKLPVGVNEQRACTMLWRSAFDAFGRSRFEPIEQMGGVVGYCAKYLLKHVTAWSFLGPQLRWSGRGAPSREKRKSECSERLDRSRTDVRPVIAGAILPKNVARTSVLDALPPREREAEEALSPRAGQLVLGEELDELVEVDYDAGGAPVAVARRRILKPLPRE